jgi:DNA-binding transcriptional LysR family regulator
MIPDLAHLQILDCLLRECSLTRTADVLGMTQPSVSRCLAKLRKHFGDTLFVRAGNTMQPTARALELAQPVAAVLAAARQLDGHSICFDPAASDRTFRLYMVDGAIVYVVPRLLRRLEDSAPGVLVRTVHCDSRALEQQMEQGRIDLALGCFPELVNNIHERQLWADDYVILMRRGHPCAAGLDRASFLEQRHVLIAADYASHQYAAVTRVLEAMLPSSRVLCHVPSFTAAAHIVLRTDALATIPRRLAYALASDLDLAIVETPIDLAPLHLSLYWHERAHREPANQWFRDFVRSAMSDADGTAGGA